MKVLKAISRTSKSKLVHSFCGHQSSKLEPSPRKVMPSQACSYPYHKIGCAPFLNMVMTFSLSLSSLSSPPLLSFSPTDPQVKVIGNPSAVQKARELILADLDAKATRVTLKIDIPFSEHSHVIGKEGCNIKKGMDWLYL